MNKPNITIKSSITLVVLFCFASVCKASGLVCANDTIIIDGKTVVVERVVEYEDPIVVEPDKKDNDDKPVRRHVGYAGGGIGPSILMVNREVPNSAYQTLDEFIGCPGNLRVGARAHGLYGRKWKKWGVEVAPSLDLEWYKNTFFSQSTLDDSLYQFSSPENCVLNQITRHDLVIGVEFYDVEAQLNRSPLFMMNLHLPVNAVYFHKIDRENHLELRAGLGPYWTLRMVGGPIVLMNENAEYEYVSESELQNTVAWNGLISADWVIKPDHGVESYIAFGAWFSPSFSPHFEENSLYNQTVTRFGARVSFNTFFKRNRNKVAQ